MLDYVINAFPKLLQATVEHIQLVVISLCFALVIASVSTIWLHFHTKWQSLSLNVLSLLYAVPSFAFFALLIPFTGLGQTTAVIVLTIYAQYMLVRSFLAGLAQVDESVKQAAVGMGMTVQQVFWKIELPLSLPAIFIGIRLTLTAIVAITTIAASINAGGLGTVLFDGLRTMSLMKLTVGILLTVAVSILLNVVVYLVEEIMKA